MRVAVTGATGVIGRAVVGALVSAGHDVVGMARTPQKALLLEERGASAFQTSIGDHDGLVAMFDGADAVCNFATHIPVGLSAAWPPAWRTNDLLRTEGVRRVVDAARAAGVRRLVQESVSFLYADQLDDWITEESPVAITRATEPASVGESHVQEYECDSRVGVVLRFGALIGDDALTRWQLKLARHGRSFGFGDPTGWAHVMHTDDLGSAVLAALQAPSGIYNVGADPVRREELVQGYAAAVGRERGSFMGPVKSRLGGVRVEPFNRSLRVSSEHFVHQTGWKPERATFDSSWLDLVGAGAAR